MSEVKIEDLVRELRGITEKLADPLAKATREAAFTAIGNYKRRLFANGQDSNDGRIGSYSTKPTYVSIAGQKRKTGSQISNGKLQGRGKNSKKPNFENGKPRKSMYFSGGYKEFRQVVGRQASKKDFFLSGELERSIQVGKTGKSVVIGFLKDEKYELATKLERQSKKAVFSFSDKEVDIALDLVEDRLVEALNKLL